MPLNAFRLKIFLIIMSIVAAIVAATIGASLTFIRSELQRIVLNNIGVIADIADKLVTTELELLHAKAEKTASALNGADQARWPEILQAEAHAPFMALSALSGERVVADWGWPPTGRRYLMTSYAEKCRQGVSNASATSREPSGELVLRVCVPLRGGLLVAALPGMHFSDLLSGQKIWDTGTVYILDEEGTVLANDRRYLVANRYNAIKQPQRTKELDSARDFTLEMIKGGAGHGEYILEGVNRLGYYRPVTGSKNGWRLGVSAPLQESPAAHVGRGLLVMAVIFLALGSIAAFFSSGYLAKQFKIIDEQYIHIKELGEMAKSASEAKSAFLANMSHEMRTPLNAIIGFSELMLHSKVDKDDRNKYMENVRLAGMTLLNIINDILDISKIVSGDLKIINKDYDIASLLNDTINVNLIRKGEKAIEFKSHFDKNIPYRMIGDELRIKQICNNLLTNAFKYTQEGQVDFFVSSRTESSHVWLDITVSDTGIGIKPEDVSKLFSDYSQVDTNSNRAIEGTGLGLAITKRLVELMDGAIDVQSVYGQGTTFRVSIKQGFVTDVAIGRQVADNLENVKYLHKRPFASDLAVTPMPYGKVLVVDDVQANLDVARGMLKPYGLQVDCVLSGQQAIELIRAEKVVYDAIFMDHMMPVMDGVETVRVIRQEIGTDYARNVPVIALTANAIVGIEQMFLANGFQAYLSKPIDLKLMDLALKQWVQDKSRQAALLSSDAEPAPEAPPEAPAEAPAPPPAVLRHAVEGLDLEEALKRFSGDWEVLKCVLKSYAETLLQLLEQLRDPTADNLRRYAIAVHGAKSSSFGVCAKQAGTMAQELERLSISGDLEGVLTLNGAFVAHAEKLAGDVRQFVQQAEAVRRKPLKKAPDPAVVAKLAQACARYDMDGVDQAISELEQFSYENEPDLAQWLREKVDALDFPVILKRVAPND
ncbi:MAG: response regulator [Deltaproteobacteria bacterium]|jgi:signal transduction histidine kinase/CheY-like chemotaxis protein|nr:response regulator [Deltaproteobacteria bacterium]